MILLIDNVDSFVHNLQRYFVRLGQDTKVVRAGEITSEEVRQWAPSAIVFSPGPGAPTESCPAVQLVREFHESIPMLGVCLGHQQIVFAMGGNVIRSEAPVHGRSSAIWHDGLHEFQSLPNPFPAARYHSLVAAENVPATLMVTARTEDNIVMAVRGSDTIANRNIYGWQFHPESILTPHGFQLLAGFLRRIGQTKLDLAIESSLSERPLNKSPEKLQAPAKPTHPVTF